MKRKTSIIVVSVQILINIELVVIIKILQFRNVKDLTRSVSNFKKKVVHWFCLNWIQYRAEWGRVRGRVDTFRSGTRSSPVCQTTLQSCCNTSRETLAHQRSRSGTGKHIWCGSRVETGYALALYVAAPHGRCGQTSHDQQRMWCRWGGACDPLNTLVL